MLLSESVKKNIKRSVPQKIQVIVRSFVHLFGIVFVKFFVRLFDLKKNTHSGNEFKIDSYSRIVQNGIFSSSNLYANLFPQLHFNMRW